MRISKIEKIPTEIVYDITVNNSHHYILENGVITHNSGLEYAASTIVFLTKKKDKDKETKEVSGVIITANLSKSRLTIENKAVETCLDYRVGLDPYYGLVDLAVKFGIFKKLSTRLELPDGKKVFQSVIEKEPYKYFTKELLDEIDKHCETEFLYGKTPPTTPIEGEETNELSN